MPCRNGKMDNKQWFAITFVLLSIGTGVLTIGFIEKSGITIVAGLSIVIVNSAFLGDKLQEKEI